MSAITLEAAPELVLNYEKAPMQDAIRQAVQQILSPMMKEASVVLTTTLSKRVTQIESTVIRQNKDMLYKLEKIKTPTSVSPHGGLQQNVIEIAQQLILHQKYNDAFSRVLGAKDQKAIEWLIKQLNPEIMRELSQSIILSLMMQISRDFGNELVERMKWIKIACDHLRVEDEMIVNSAGKVLEEVLRGMAKSKPNVPEEYLKKYNRVMHFVNSLYQSAESE
jgi:vancomycin resistance protein YoaR